MDPITILLSAIAAISACMSVGQAVETYALWKLKAQIPIKIREGCIAVLKDPELVAQFLSQEMFDSVSVAMWENFKHHVEKWLQGQAGKYQAAEKGLGAAFWKDLNPLLDLIPDGKFKKKLEQHPEWIGIGMKFLGPLLERMQGQAQEGGEFGVLIQNRAHKGQENRHGAHLQGQGQSQLGGIETRRGSEGDEGSP